MVFNVLDINAKTYEYLMAVPVIKGVKLLSLFLIFKVKTEAEKFPGGHKSTTLETWIPENGRGIQVIFL